MSEMEAEIYLGSSKLIAFATLIENVEEVISYFIEQRCGDGLRGGRARGGVTPEKRV